MKLSLYVLAQLAAVEAAPQFGSLFGGGGSSGGLGGLGSLFGGGGSSGGLGGLGALFGGGDTGKLVRTKTLTAKLRPGAVKKAFYYGPMTLKGKDESKMFGSLDPKGQSDLYTITKGPCHDVEGGCTVLSVHWQLEHADSGKLASPENNVYIHHMLSFDTTKKPNSPLGGFLGNNNQQLASIAGSAFGDRGEDSGDTATTFVSANSSQLGGYHMKKEARLFVQTDLVNYDDKQKKLFLVLEVEYLPGQVGHDAGASLKTVRGGINLNGVTKSAPVPVTADCNIVWARGHLHAGGVKMEMSVNNKIVCTSLPTYDAQGVITQMSLCPQTISLKKGDTMTVDSYYDTNKHALRKSTDGSGHAAHGLLGQSDVMGMFAMTYETL